MWQVAAGRALPCHPSPFPSYLPFATYQSLSKLLKTASSRRRRAALTSIVLPDQFARSIPPHLPEVAVRFHSKSSVIIERLANAQGSGTGFSNAMYLVPPAWWRKSPIKEPVVPSYSRIAPV